MLLKHAETISRGCDPCAATAKGAAGTFPNAGRGRGRWGAVLTTMPLVSESPRMQF